MSAPREIPGRYRIVELNDSGNVRSRYGVNFKSQTEAVDYAEGYLGLPRPDLDVLGWTVDGRRFVIQEQLSPGRTALLETFDRFGTE